MSRQYDMYRANEMADSIGGTRGWIELSATARYRIATWAGAEKWEDISKEDQKKIITTYKISRKKYILRLYQDVIIDLIELNRLFDGQFDSVEDMCFDFASKMIEAWKSKLELHPNDIDSRCFPENERYEYKSKDERGRKKGR